MTAQNITLIFKDGAIFPEKKLFYCGMLIEGYFRLPSSGDLYRALQILVDICLEQFLVLNVAHDWNPGEDMPSAYVFLC